MIALRARWIEHVDQQHRYPTGWLGHLVGERMTRQHAPETRWSTDLLDLLPTDRVLEIGCGAGNGLALALKHGAVDHATGLDLSPTMLRAAARRNRAALADGRLSLLLGDLAALPLQAQGFTKIVSVHTFYFWPDPLATVRRIGSLLAPGGRFVATFATAKTTADGTREYWPIHEQARTLVAALDQMQGFHAALRTGPDSRQFNNVAIVFEREAAGA